MLVVFDLVKNSKKATTAVNPGMRAVIIPTNDAARTVVVPPCGTGAGEEDNPTLAQTTAGVVTFELPQGFGTRIVLVPRCSGRQGGAANPNNLPSAAFVDRPGTGIPPIGPGNSISNSSSVEPGEPNTAEFQVTVPNGSAIRTVIVPPCLHTLGPAQVLLGNTSDSPVAVAPAC